MLNIIYSRCEECPGCENLRDHLYNSTRRLRRFTDYIPTVGWDG